jgi:hypothetical protein
MNRGEVIVSQLESIDKFWDKYGTHIVLMCLAALVIMALLMFILPDWFFTLNEPIPNYSP